MLLREFLSFVYLDQRVVVEELSLENPIKRCSFLRESSYDVPDSILSSKVIRVGTYIDTYFGSVLKVSVLSL